MSKSRPTNFDPHESLEVIWDALHAHRESNIPEGVPEYDEAWNDICTAMAWITEAISDEGRNAE